MALLLILCAACSASCALEPSSLSAAGSAALQVGDDEVRRICSTRALIRVMPTSVATRGKGTSPHRRGVKSAGASR